MKYIFQFIIVLISLNMVGQEMEVRVVYQGVFNVTKYDEKLNDRKISKEEKQNLLNWISSAKRMTEKAYTLELNRFESIYKERDKLSLNTNSQSPTNVAKEAYYKNLTDNKYVKKTSLTGKRYLIIDSLEKFDWKMSEETKKIGKYTCHKATYIYKGITQERKEHSDGTFETIIVNTDFPFTAWYTTEIPISNGPERFGGLPGLILELDSYNTSKLVCTEIEFNPDKKVKISVPTGGKKVTNKEYEIDIGYKNPNE